MSWKWVGRASRFASKIMTFSCVLTKARGPFHFIYLQTKPDTHDCLHKISQWTLALMQSVMSIWPCPAVNYTINMKQTQDSGQHCWLKAKQSIVKQGDNVLGSKSLSVHLSVCPSICALRAKTIIPKNIKVGPMDSHHQSNECLYVPVIRGFWQIIQLVRSIGSKDATQSPGKSAIFNSLKIAIPPPFPFYF